MNTAAIPMQIEGPAEQPLLDEMAVLQDMLPLAGARLLDLGCGAAEKTRQLVERTDVAAIVAAEVDQVQHAKNLRIDDLPKVRFESFGAEDIQSADASFDIVVMFKSLHHVPADSLDQALAEISRVLKPGGLAYFSEPVFAGAFNEVIRLFHDESSVRQQAFDALGRAVRFGTLDLVEERFFRNRLRLQSFDQFDTGILQATHTDHNVGPALLAQVRETFERYRSDDGYVFEIPNRVDLLRKPGSPA